MRLACVQIECTISFFTRSNVKSLSHSPKIQIPILSSGHSELSFHPMYQLNNVSSRIRLSRHSPGVQKTVACSCYAVQCMCLVCSHPFIIVHMMFSRNGNCSRSVQHGPSMAGELESPKKEEKKKDDRRDSRRRSRYSCHGRDLHSTWIHTL